MKVSLKALCGVFCMEIDVILELMDYFFLYIFIPILPVVDVVRLGEVGAPCTLHQSITRLPQRDTHTHITAMGNLKQKS